LIERAFAALRSARLRYLRCFPLKSRGEKGAPAPLFAASARVISSTTRVKPACASNAGKLPHAKVTVATLPHNREATLWGTRSGFRSEYGGLLAFPCRRGAQGNSFPAARAGWARRNVPIPLLQNGFSASEGSGFGPHLIFSLSFPVRQGKHRPPLAASRTAAEHAR
jgi:hypothetical protein